jgi:iron complex transport system permease protein
VLERRAASAGVALLIAFALLAAMIASLAFGAYPLSITALFSNQLDATAMNVLTQIRAPRIITACVAGAAFALAGAALQALFRNPLADPGLLGVPAAAALGAAISIVLFAGASASLVVWPAAIIGAGAAVVALIAFAQRSGSQATASLLLLGVAINAACGAALALITSLATETQLRTLAFWMLGSFSNLAWETIIVMFVCVVVAATMVFRDGNALSALALGERTARSLGVELKTLRIRVAIACALLVAVVTAFCGNVAFVGLAAPHLARMLVGARTQSMMLISMLIGALLCVIADIIARALAVPVELPVGAVTSIIGVPILVWLIIRLTRRNSFAGASQ